MKSQKIIYLDNAATTYPKHAETVAAVLDFMSSIGASAGRSGHSLSVASGRIVYEAREAVAKLFNAPDPSRVIFTNNATSAINTALYGFLKNGDSVVVSPFEHNSVMRPLHELQKTENISLKIAKKNSSMQLDLGYLYEKSKAAKLIAIVHGNNVTGSVADLKSISKIAEENGCKLLVDAAQTAGLIDIDTEKINIDFLTFSGHKGLYGPQGTGALILGRNVDCKSMKTLTQGGTGSLSEQEIHPEYLPDKFESGTLNCMGLAGLKTSVNLILDSDVTNRYIYEKAKRDKLLNALLKIEKVNIFAAPISDVTTNVLSFTIDNISVSDIAIQLDEKYNIMARVGLHCAPAVHKALGTFPNGTVRLSTGAFTTEEEIDYTIEAIREIALCR